MNKLLGLFLLCISVAGLCIGVSGCNGDVHIENVKTETGVTCHQWIPYQCGYDLSDCDDGNKYECVGIMHK